MYRRTFSDVHKHTKIDKELTLSIFNKNKNKFFKIFV